MLYDGTWDLLSRKEFMNGIVNLVKSQWVILLPVSDQRLVSTETHNLSKY